METLNESTSDEQRFFYPCGSKSGKYRQYFSAFGTFGE